MLLRRITEHLQTQNWTAVGIDIVVVILGVFLGFQVTEWNEQRLLSNQRDVYLTRIVGDLERDVEEANRVVAANLRIMEAIQLLEDIGRDPKIAVKDPEAFLMALRLASGTRQIVLVRDTFDELRSAGHLALLANPSLQSKLIRYYSERVVRDQFRTFNTLPHERYRTLAMGLLDIKQKMATWLYRDDFEWDYPELDVDQDEALRIANAMAARPELLDVLPALHEGKFGSMREGRRTKNQAEALIALIETELMGRSTPR